MTAAGGSPPDARPTATGSASGRSPSRARGAAARRRPVPRKTAHAAAPELPGQRR